MGSMGSSPVRWRTAAFRDSTGKMAMPSTQRSSLALAAGTRMRCTPRSTAAITIGSTPRTGRTVPSSDSSPSTQAPSQASGSITPRQVRMPRAMGRS